MKALRSMRRQALSAAAALVTLGGVVTPGLVPAFASADTITDRQVVVSDSAPGATASYEFKFKAAQSDTKSFTVKFSNAATAGTAQLIAPATATLSGATAATYAQGADASSFTATLGTAVAAGADVDVIVPGVTNPAKGIIYAQIATKDTAGDPLDDGTVAISINDSIAVGGSVLETLQFCASGGTIDASCGGTLTTPAVSFGDLGTAVKSGTINSQVSTNAASGVVVSIKSNTVGCGGLVRLGAASNAAGCGIGPQTTAEAITSGAAKFGMKLNNEAGDFDLASSGVTAATGYDDNSKDFFNYKSGDTEGVTSTYGDPIYSVAGPVSSTNVPLTFDANISDTTPAGSYNATLNLIATGKF